MPAGILLWRVGMAYHEPRERCPFPNVNQSFRSLTVLCHHPAMLCCGVDPQRAEIRIDVAAVAPRVPIHNMIAPYRYKHNWASAT